MAEKEENVKSEAALREEAVLAFWQENKTFEKSLEKKSPKGNYVFYDGPPFATGLPHYGHILGSTVKDVIGRYQTMQGFHVPRKWGWDCHGLPIENIVEKDLGISGKKGIEEYGIEKFTEYARSKVLTYVHEWKKTVDRMGRWVDFDNSYKTMDNTFIESVWWALGELNKKELLYEGVRVLAYCPRCETPIANSEIAMDNSYKDITDISVYVKFKLVGEENTYLIAWTTTPWTLPGNTAIALNKDIDYVYVKTGEDILILAKDRFEILKDKFLNGEVVKEIKGSELVGLSYEPVFDYYKNIEIQNKENIWKIWHADFVTVDKGTGIAHQAPAFGEEDMELAKANNVPFIRHVEPNGVFSKEVVDFVGVKAKPKEDPQSTDVLIIKYLAGKGTLFAKEKIIHSYPHCYRCDTPLLYYALPSWFVNIQKVKKDLLKDAESINWIPEHLKEGRFKNIMENAPDWTISRNRYWASPLPFWKSESGKLMVINSIEDLKKKTKKSGNKYFVMRHGETEANLKNLVSTVINSGNHLTKNGEAKTRKTAESLKKENLDLIIISPFNRTRETAVIVAEVLNMSPDQIIVDNRLGELKVPSYEGKSWDEYHKDFQKIPENFDKAKEGDESYTDLKSRVTDFIFEIEEKYKNKKILIITHGGPAWLIESSINMLNIQDILNLIKDKKDFHYFENSEVKELDFIPFPHDALGNVDLHRPYIDAITLIDEKGTEYKRIPEVIDCWFESGSMPFAQDHFPFERPDWKEKNFPAGFVAEYISQTRTWFYYTHAISSILFGKAPFENVVTTGTVLAEDGSKMSKSKNNFPDPWILFNKYGVDALRFYLMSCPLMKGEDVNFSEKAVQDIASKIIGRLDNVVAFYELYRDKNLENVEIIKSTNVLDVWIIARLNQLITEVTNGMETYDMALSARPFDLFIEDLSTWYLRRSRDRLKDDDKEAKTTLYFIIKTLVKLLAPFTPFISENIWLRLSQTESVHLAEWPKANEIDSSVLEKMEKVRAIITKGLELRQKAGIKIRQPLQSFTFEAIDLDEYHSIIKDELNVKEIINGELAIDTNITEELKAEGNYRDLVRAVQDFRKQIGLISSDLINLSLETSIDGEKIVDKFKNELLKTVGAKEIKFAKNEGIEVKIDELVFKIKIDKI